MMRIHADQIRPGDVVEYLGVAHHIRRVHARDGALWPVASDGTGWAMALGRQLVLVHRTAA